jgi:hypothetical protein
MDEDRVRVCEDGEGVEARTEWECLAASVRFSYTPSSRAPTDDSEKQSDYSLLRLKPATGRKHQLRVHCADVLRGTPSLSFFSFLTLTLLSTAPIVGDFKLAPSAPHAAALEDLSIPLDSVLLHASTLSFFVRFPLLCPPTLLTSLSFR